MNKRNVLASMATAGGQRNIASFAAIRAIVKTIRAESHVVLSLADRAVPFAGTALFRQVALRAIGRSLHKRPLRKLYLTIGCRGKAHAGSARRPIYLPFASRFSTLLKLT